MILKPFDVLLYQNYGYMGTLISWGEWVGRPGEALQYSHVGLVYADITQSFEMNPPAARVFPMSQVPMNRLDVWRLAIGGVDVFDDADAVAAAKAQADAMVGKPYDYGFIGKALGASVLARVGLSGLASRWMQANQPTQHSAVCSNTAEVVIGAGVRVHHPDWTIEPQGIGPGEMEPSDWPLVNGLYRVAS